MSSVLTQCTLPMRQGVLQLVCEPDRMVYVQTFLKAFHSVPYWRLNMFEFVTVLAQRLHPITLEPIQEGQLLFDHHQCVLKYVAQRYVHGDDAVFNAVLWNALSAFPPSFHYKWTAECSRLVGGASAVVTEATNQEQEQEQQELQQQELQQQEPQQQEQEQQKPQHDSMPLGMEWCMLNEFD